MGGKSKIQSSDNWPQSFIDGNQEAIATFYEKEYAKLVFFVYSYVLNKERATDLASQVFLKLLQMPQNKRASLLPATEHEFKKYVYSMAKNAVIDGSRKQKSKEKFDLEAKGNTANNNNDALSFIANDSYEKVAQNLGTQQRTIFEMHANGYNNQEIAQKLAISNNTVKNTLVTAKKKLRTLWNSYF